MWVVSYKLCLQPPPGCFLSAFVTPRRQLQQQQQQQMEHWQLSKANGFLWIDMTGNWCTSPPPLPPLLHFLKCCSSCLSTLSLLLSLSLSLRLCLILCRKSLGLIGLLWVATVCDLAKGAANIKLPVSSDWEWCRWCRWCTCCKCGAGLVAWGRTHLIANCMLVFFFWNIHYFQLPTGPKSDDVKAK